MSPFGAPRALGSSVMGESGVAVEEVRCLFSGVARVSKACGLGFSVSAQWGSFSTVPAPKQFWKLMYEALTREDRTRVAANWSRPGQFFSLFLDSTCAVWGSFLGAGITRFRPAWKVAGGTPLSPWEGAARTP